MAHLASAPNGLAVPTVGDSKGSLPSETTKLSLPLGRQRIPPAGATKDLSRWGVKGPLPLGRQIRHLKKQREENCTRECCGVTV